MHIEGFLKKKNKKGFYVEYFFNLEEQSYRLEYFLKDSSHGVNG